YVIRQPIGALYGPSFSTFSHVFAPIFCRAKDLHPLRIDPLSPVDTGEYIGMRLHRAGCDRELFASDAIAMIHEAAMGGMRDADRLATAALREAARKKRKLVERDAVARTIDAHTNGDTGV